MSGPIKTRIIKIGNSHGIRIPKPLMEQAGLVDEVELEARANQLIVRPVRAARQGWDAQFQAMARAGDDRLLERKIPNSAPWPTEGWEW